MTNGQNETKKFSEIVKKIKEEIGKVIIGQSELVEKIIIALLSKGHILIEGNPGLGKTLLVLAFSKSIGCSSERIQFTPDLLPSDIIGTLVWKPNLNKFEEEYGPITKANFIIADEINRAPPKVHSALLEAMQERKVTIVGSKNEKRLDSPFMVLATQNPIESEGVFDLPSAQIDRFMFKLKINYPSSEEELKIMEIYSKDKDDYNDLLNNISPIEKDEILKMQKSLKEIKVRDDIYKYVYNIISETRNSKELIEIGASPRAAIDLILAGRAKALIEDRGSVESEDIEHFVKDVLRHRIILNTMEVDIKDEEEAKEKLIDSILKKVEPT